MNRIKRDWKILNKNLQDLLYKKRMSVTELSREVAVPKSNIFSWMNGAKPDIYQLDKVARFFDVSIEYLIFGRVREKTLGQNHE